MIIIILLIIIICLFLIAYRNKIETYKVNTDNLDKEILEFEKDKVKGSTISLDDKLFDDVILYRGTSKFDGEIGTDKCIKKCVGNCVDNGPTGDTFCFPTKPFLSNDTSKFYNNRDDIILEKEIKKNNQNMDFTTYNNTNFNKNNGFTLDDKL